MDDAEVSLDGLAKTANDEQEFKLNQLPLPITHKDFFINLRQLSASRQRGERSTPRRPHGGSQVVAEKLEKMLFQGGPTFGGCRSTATPRTRPAHQRRSTAARTGATPRRRVPAT
jgi:hypothetical protein